jgi:purine-nucleoside phosphorylase
MSPSSASTPPLAPTPAQAAAAQVQANAERLRAAWPAAAGAGPRIGLVLGSGWRALADAVQGAAVLPCSELPGFPQPAIGGHSGTLTLGLLGRQPVAVLGGREHPYEHGNAGAMKVAVRTLAALGCSTLVLTNAAGSLRADMPTGSLMLISDHLNLVQATPLLDEEGSARFVDLSQAYDAGLRTQAQAAAQAAGLAMHEGIYAWMLGPQFETPAEIRMLRTLGADAVGMSTVPETILARHAGMKVLALSLITNLAAGMAAEALSHAQTLAAANAAAQRAVATMLAIVAGLEA